MMTLSGITAEAHEMSLGSLLKNRRSRLGMTQKEVAERADIGLSYYKQVETDRSSPTVEKAASLMQVLNIDPRAMFREFGVGPTDEEHAEPSEPDGSRSHPY